MIKWHVKIHVKIQVLEISALLKFQPPKILAFLLFRWIKDAWDQVCCVQMRRNDLLYIAFQVGVEWVLLRAQTDLTDLEKNIKNSNFHFFFKMKISTMATVCLYTEIILHTCKLRSLQTFSIDPWRMIVLDVANFITPSCGERHSQLLQACPRSI